MPVTSPIGNLKVSDLTPYFDWKRFAQLLCDVNTDIPAGSETALDTNLRALALIKTAYSDLLMAVLEGEQYSKKEIEDLVWAFLAKSTNEYLGRQVISIVADLLWMRAVQRKRYTAETPQGKDPTIERAENALEMLKKGLRIFVMEGVFITDDKGVATLDTYGNEKPVAGHAVGGDGSLLNDGYPSKLWGCKHGPNFDDSRHIRFRDDGGGCC